MKKLFVFSGLAMFGLLVFNADAVDDRAVGVLYEKGMELYKKGMYDEAQANFLKVIEREPNHVDSHFRLAVIAEKKLKISKAIEYYQKVIALDAGHAKSYYNLGNIYRSQKKLEDAVQSYQKATDASPKMLPAWINLLNTYVDLEKLDDAINLGQSKIKEFSDSAELFYSLAYACQQADKVELARKYCQKALELKPDFPYAKTLMKMLQKQTNNSESKE